MAVRFVGKLIILFVAASFFILAQGVVRLNAQVKSPGKILVSSFKITGNTVIDTRTLQELTYPFTIRELTWEEINAAAESITMAYQERGYVLARAYIPRQEIKDDGVVEIRVLEGVLGRIDVVGNRYYNERVLKRYFKSQQEHGVIREDLLERALMLTNELPSVEAKSILKRGGVPGTTDLELHTEDRFPVKWGLDYNNFGSGLISRHRYGTSFEITDPRWGYTLSLRGTTGKKDVSMLGSAVLSIPVNAYGTKVDLSYMEANYAVGAEYAELGLEGDTQIYGGKISHPLIKERNRNLIVALGYDHKYTINYFLGVEDSIDKLSVFYTTITFDNLDRFLGRNIVSFGYYQGLNNFYAISEDDPGSSRADDADGAFSKFTLDVARIQNIYGYTNLMVKGSGQLSGDMLLAMEQMPIGGYGTVRGHDPSLYLGDSGYVVSTELMFGPPFIAGKLIMGGQRLGQLLQFALFFDHGGVFTTNPDPGESKCEYLNSAGGGIRLFYKDIFTFKVDVGIPIYHGKLETEHMRYYFMGSINFF